MKIQREFFERDTNKVAYSLIGKKLVKYVDFLGKYYKLSGIIVETEAYCCDNDTASHAFKKMTNRNRTMFGEVGKVYVYFIYGNHHCFNIVAKNNDCAAGAILIRSIQPIDGVNLMRIFRKTDNTMNLTSGPGKLTQALKISKNHNGFDLTDNKINYFFYLEEGENGDDQKNRNYNKFKVLETSRIGISSALEKKWRFIMMNPKKRKTNKSDEYIPNFFVSRRG
ncbi:MAG: DNA-3-methyladenine glycosylase [Thermoproteota archaeon]|nr:DNA-3-methyladenine glycosylase [Thermoproteota archaeon]